MNRPAELTVIVCSFNGAKTITTCLEALNSQTIRSQIQVIVVDDGSTDATAATAESYGVAVLRHGVNRGLAAARNTGVKAATASLIAFTDDDCEPAVDWAENVLAAFDGDTARRLVAVGGPCIPNTKGGWLHGYLVRNNPLEPLESELARSDDLPYRLGLYLRRQWRGPESPTRDRRVYSLVGANMCIRLDTLLEVGMFDETFRFGAEELDLFRRIGSMAPDAEIAYRAAPRVTHHFKNSLRDSMRRCRSYGLGAARLYRKFPAMRPTIFPGPLAVIVLLIAAVQSPWLLIGAAVAPLVLYPRAIRICCTTAQPDVLLDPYFTLILEMYGNVGFVKGLMRRTSASGPVPSPESMGAAKP